MDAVYPTSCVTGDRIRRGFVSIFNDRVRALAYYHTLEAEVRRPRAQRPAPFFIAIPNGLAFLRVCDTECGQRPAMLRTSEPTGLFRYYDSSPQPSLHFVLQVQAEEGCCEDSSLSMSRACNPASLEAMSTFLIKRPTEPAAAGTSWSGAAEESETSTPSETATVVAQCVQATAVSPRSAVVLRRLKRVLGQ